MMNRMVLGELGSTINSGIWGGKKSNKFLVMDIFPLYNFQLLVYQIIKKLASFFIS